MLQLSRPENEYFDAPMLMTAWVAKSWADTPIYIPHLVPQSANRVCFPSISEAKFLWRCGTIFYQDTGYASFIPWDIAGCYVEIRAVGHYGWSTVWVGRFDADSRIIYGPSTGDQILIAHGIESLLESCGRVDGAYVDNPAGMRLGKTLTFNSKNNKGFTLSGNRSATWTEEDGYLFSGDGQQWTNLQILDYVLRRNLFTPFTVVLDGQYSILDNIVDEHDLEGMSPMDCIGILAPRRRGIGVALECGGIGQTAYLRFFSLFAEPVDGGEFSIPANDRQVPVYCNMNRWANTAISKTTSNMYSDIVVIGEPIKCVFTTSFAETAEAKLVKDWDEALETEYKAADDDTRTSDKYDTVYSQYRIDPDWDWNGVSPLVTNDGHVVLNSDTGGYWNRDHHLLRTLPLEEINPLDSTQPEYRAPFGIVEIPGSGNSWMLHKLQEISPDDIESVPSNITMSMGDSGLVIKLHPSPNHVLALNHFDGAEDSAKDPIFDYETLAFTVGVETDESLRCWVSMPATGDVRSALYLRVRNAEYWYVSQNNTVYDVEAGTPVIYADPLPQVLRDDSGRVRAIAALAAAWYSKPRTTIQCNFQKLVQGYWPGTMVVSVGSIFSTTPVGTPVTELSWNFERAETTFVTGYLELDAREFYQWT